MTCSTLVHTNGTILLESGHSFEGLAAFCYLVQFYGRCVLLLVLVVFRIVAVAIGRKPRRDCRALLLTHLTLAFYAE